MDAYLGTVKIQLGNYKDAKELLEQSNDMFLSLHMENHAQRIWVLLCLGIIERKLGAFAKARNLFEQSLQAYENHLYDKKGISWCLAQLGILEKELGNYNESHTLLEHSISIENENDSIHCSRKKAWLLCHLADVYQEMGNYKKAKELIEESIALYKLHLPENHVKLARTRTTLAKIYKACDNYEQAKAILEQCLIIIEQHYGKDHIDTMRVLIDLGHISLQKGNMEAAENLMTTALRICQQNKHHKAYKPLEKLAEIYLKREMIAAQKGNLEQTQRYKNQAISYLEQARKIIEKNYPKDSPHLIRIEAHLNSLES